MSNTTRWIVAIILVLAGVLAAVFSLTFLGFFTWGCYGPSNSIASSILYVAAVIGLIAGIVPAMMLIRRDAKKSVVTALVLGLVFTLVGNGLFVFYTLNIC